MLNYILMCVFYKFYAYIVNNKEKEHSVQFALIPSILNGRNFELILNRTKFSTSNFIALQLIYTQHVIIFLLK